MSDKIIAPAPIDLPNNERTGNNPSIEDISNLSVSNDNLITVFNEAAFRVCNKCLKTRILDFRACRKFPLGSYKYGGIIQKLSFDCTRLVNTDCNSPEDIVSGKINDEINFLVLRSEKSEAPSTGLLVKNIEKVDETARKKSFKIKILLKFYFRGSKVDKLPLNDLIAEYNSNGIVKIGTPAAHL